MHFGGYWVLLAAEGYTTGFLNSNGYPIRISTPALIVTAVQYQGVVLAGRVTLLEYMDSD